MQMVLAIEHLVALELHGYMIDTKEPHRVMDVFEHMPGELRLRTIACTLMAMTPEVTVQTWRS